MSDLKTVRGLLARQRKVHAWRLDGTGNSLCRIEVMHKLKFLAVTTMPARVTCLVCRHKLGLHHPQGRLKL